MIRPKADAYVLFNKGGVAIAKTPQQAYLTFYTKLNRVVTEVPVPYYLFSDVNIKEVNTMVHSAWASARNFTPKSALSDPNKEKIQEIVDAMMVLLGLKEEIKPAKEVKEMVAEAEEEVL